MFMSGAAQNNARTSGQGITRWSLTTTVILIWNMHQRFNSLNVGPQAESLND